MTNKVVDGFNVRPQQFFADSAYGRSAYEEFKTRVLALGSAQNVLPTGGSGDVNLLMTPNTIIEAYNIGAQTLLCPVVEVDEGLNLQGDNTNGEGFELNFGTGTRASKQYVVGTDRVKLSVTFKIEDVSGVTEALVGFRKLAANEQAVTSYTDYAFITVTAGDIDTRTRLNTGTAVDTDSTDNRTDGQTKTLSVEVAQNGAVAFYIDDVTPTVTQEFTFDDGDIIIPFIRGVQATDLSETRVRLIDLDCPTVN